MPEQPGRSNQSGSRSRKSRKALLGSQKRAGSASDSDSDAAILLGDDEARLALRESDKLYYRIGEVSRLTSVKAHVLRYWETEFRWMAPPKSRSKQRLYRKRDIEFVWLLKRLLWDERYTIAGARQRIQELGVEDALALLDQTIADSHTPQSTRAQTDAASNEATDAAPSHAAWVSFRAALEEMQGELVNLKRTLQDGA